MNKVHGILLSPFVRKVLLTLEHKGQAYENIGVIPGSKAPEFKAISPLGKIPVYEDEYGAVQDSSVICQYLDSKYPSPSIYPGCPRERAHALWLEEFSDSKLAELLGGGIFFEIIVAPKMMKRPTDEQKVKNTYKLLPPLLEYLESQISAAEFLIGNTISIADLTVPNFFINAGYAGFSVDKTRWPKLANYLDNMLAHPLFITRLEAEKDILAAFK